MVTKTAPPPAESSGALELPSDRAALARADFVSQTTAVEQARAVAEVRAAVEVAQFYPRHMPKAISEMEESCTQIGLAERSFYRFPRGGGAPITGASVALARELARCFGNVDYGIRELRRDDVGRYSEMQAWAWDVERNTRSTLNFVVPHKRDKKGGPEDLIDMRDIYENNANMGARRLREAIFSILPAWFTEKAKALCSETLEKGAGDAPLPLRITRTIEAFAKLGVKLDRLEARQGPSSSWTTQDLAVLQVIGASIKQGTVSVDEEFPPVRVTAAELSEGQGELVAP